MKQFGLNDLAISPSINHLEQIENRRILLKDILNFCIERDLKPCIVLLPMHESLYKKFPKDFFEDYIGRFLRGIEIDIFDYTCDHNLTDEDFKTSLFLSTAGAIKFTNMFQKELYKNKQYK